jgi:hypothetical protein
MNPHRLKYLVLALSCAAPLIALATDATHDEMQRDPAIQKMVRAMDDASTWYHPDLYGEFAGVRRYMNKDYSGAMKYFEIGAYYADKLSQLSIGLMYVNGEGVAKDPVTGYAWLELAAERDYPEFVATRDRVKATLTPDEMQKARGIHDTLALRYADTVAKPRMETQLALGKMQITGSHLGAFGNIVHSRSKDNCSGANIIGNQVVPEAGCGGDAIYAEARWQPKKYFASRDAQWKATVTVGDIAPGSDSSAKPDAKPDDKH